MSKRTPETIQRIRSFQEEARECAAQMTANGGYIQQELGNVRMNDELRTRTQELCTDFGALHFDLLSEILDINRLLEEDDSNDEILGRVELIEKWAQDEMLKMHGIVQELDAAAETDVMKVGAYLLLSESAVNILKPLRRMRELAAQLRGELR